MEPWGSQRAGLSRALLHPEWLSSARAREAIQLSRARSQALLVEVRAVFRVVFRVVYQVVYQVEFPAVFLVLVQG